MTVVLAAGDLRATLSALGATLVELWVPGRSGVATNVVVSSGPYAGATVGRYANRIARGRCTVDGTVLALVTNDGPNHLHGGVVGFDQRTWDAEPGPDGRSATFGLVSDDGDEGYPGRLEVTARYTLDESALTMSFEATTDRPTIVNLTNHAYWNLAGGGPVAAHELWVAAEQYLPVDDTNIPTGGLAPVAGTEFDFRQRRPIGPQAGVGYDHCFLLDGGGLRPVAELRDPASGRTMTVSTDQPGLQLYTGGHLDPPHTAVCLETQLPPDSPNQPVAGDAVLRPGEVYSHTTVHTFSLT